MQPYFRYTTLGAALLFPALASVFRASLLAYFGSPAMFFIPVSDRGTVLRPRLSCGVELPIALFDAASPLVPGNGGADMVWASSLACSGGNAEPVVAGVDERPIELTILSKTHHQLPDPVREIVPLDLP